jgi:hypothetical protein
MLGVLAVGAAVLGAAAFACAPDGDSLLGDGTGPGSSSSSSGAIGDGGDLAEASVQQLSDKALAMFRAIEPDLDKTCGGPCHQDGVTGAAPRWLAPPDAYVSIRAYPGIITPDPDTSKLLTRGPHAGPAMPQDLGARTRDWLSVEALLIKKQVLPTTDPFTIATGPNSIDISKAGTGVDGAKITFDATINGSLLTLSSVKLVAPATTAVHVAHPLFVMLLSATQEKPDPVDSFSNTDQTVGAGQSGGLGPGELLWVNWVGGSQMKIEFNKLEPGKAVGDSGTGGGGCKSVATYGSSAVPAIQGNTCLNCHQGQNPNATSALDMTQVGKDNTAACGQALSKVNLADKPNSAIILAPTGKIQHPFQVGDAQGWTNAILGWINNE